MITDTGRSERTQSTQAATRLGPRVASLRLALSSIDSREVLSWGLPALLAAAYLIVLLVSFKQVITSINLYGDAVIAPVLAKLLGQAPAGSQVVLGHHAYYEEFLFLRATAGLSFFRRLWEVAPLVWTLLGVGVLAWSARRALGGFAALLTACALVCLGALGRYSFFTFDWHGLTVIHTIVICGALVWFAPRATRIGWRGVIAAGVVVGLISALPAASDVLFAFWALIPMVLAAVAISARTGGPSRWSPIAFALITATVSLVAGAVIAHILRTNGITASEPPYTFVSSGAMVLHNARLLVEGYMALGGGYFFGSAINVVGLLIFASGVLIVGALVLGPVEVRRVAIARNRLPSLEATPPATRGYIAFWASSLVIQAVVFVATGVPKFNTGASRYALAGYVAVMALFPLLLRRGPRWRTIVTAGVCLFAISSVVQLARKPFAPFGPYPTPTVASRVLLFAKAHHVRYGYAGYWDAPDLTWLTRFRLEIYPIESGCGPNGICPTSPARINTWYVPRPGARSMLIADPAFPGVHSLEAKLGSPLAITRIGRLTLAVYPYDIASSFGSAPGPKAG